LNINLKNT